MLIVLPGTKNKYALIAAEDRFEMMLAHQLRDFNDTYFTVIGIFAKPGLQAQHFFSRKNILLALQLSL